MSLIVGTAVAGGGSAPYQISRSLRFNPADTTYLNRTFSTPTNNKIWTWSSWVKKSALGGSGQELLFVFPDGSNYAYIQFTSGDALELGGQTGGVNFSRITSAVFRDLSAWYAINVIVDTTLATANDRIKIYVNNVLQTLTGTAPTQNSNLVINTAVAHQIGRHSTSGNYYFGGYMAEVYFIDGQALTPSSFGQTNPNTGVWEPINYTGTYGTNGFELSFADNSGATSTTLGKDTSGNGNNWTPNNFSVTAGTGNDSLVDSPTSYGTDTGVGGEVRGNYCTWNPLSSNAIPTLTNGNLDTPSNQNNKAANGIIGVSSGKWYWEITVNNNSQPCPYLGVTSRSQENDPDSAPTLAANTGRSVVRLASPYVYKNYTSTGGIATGATSTGNFGTVGVALNFDTGEIKYYFNNTLLHTDSTIPTSGVTLFPYYGLTNSGGAGWNSSSVNFGQRPFAYTAPSGFKALCTQNLPTPTIGATSTTQANDYMNVVLYTGDGTANRSVTGVGFQPDLVWAKSRSAAYYNGLFDNLRSGRALYSNSTDAEDTTEVVAFGSDGFTTPNKTSDFINTNSATYVAWNWKANGAGVTNTAGTITSTVSANTTSGFSIVTYTGNFTASQTVGHGLSTAPVFIIAKRRGATSDWGCIHPSLAATQIIRFNLTGAAETNDWFANTRPTSSVFYVGQNSNTNPSGGTMVAYCFAPVAGYSAFGSYTGNGSADGPFVFTNFRPKYVMIKNITTGGAGYDWFVWDTSRDPYNLTYLDLNPNSAQVENTNSGDGLDILSNGFKIRVSTAATNTSGNTFIYACFAESPFKYALAR